MEQNTFCGLTLHYAESTFNVYNLKSTFCKYVGITLSNVTSTKTSSLHRDISRLVHDTERTSPEGNKFN